MPKGAPVLGWLTFLCDARGAVPALDGPFRVERVGDGSLITVEGDGPPEDAEVLRLLAEQLGPELLQPS